MGIYGNLPGSAIRKIRRDGDSLVITLPSWVCKAMRWGPGDEVSILADFQHGEITIRKKGDGENVG